MPDNVTAAEVAAKNHIYDAAATAVWHMLVYEPVHDGWAFANIGGAAALDAIASAANLTPASRVLELCCGIGDTCRYLAERTGCSVVGVDINARQIAAARQRLLTRPPTRGHVALVHADVASLAGDKPFDLVYAIDSLVLLPDLESVLGRARRLLRPGGHFAAAEVIAGRRLSDRFRHYVWEEDGFISLLTEEEYIALLERAGFADATVQGRRAAAVNCFQTIWRQAGRRRDLIAAACGTGAYREWRRLSAIYTRAFRGQWLSYVWLHARRADGSCMRTTKQLRRRPRRATVA